MDDTCVYMRMLQVFYLKILDIVQDFLFQNVFLYLYEIILIRAAIF